MTQTHTRIETAFKNVGFITTKFVEGPSAALSKRLGETYQDNPARTVRMKKVYSKMNILKKNDIKFHALFVDSNDPDYVVCVEQIQGGYKVEVVEVFYEGKPSRFKNTGELLTWFKKDALLRRFNKFELKNAFPIGVIPLRASDKDINSVIQEIR